MTPIQNATKHFATPAPTDILQNFCACHTEVAAQLEIRRWFILALKANYDGLSSVRTTTLISFYEQLRAVITALYRLEDDPGTPPSLSLALEELRPYLRPNTLLLFEPFE